MMRWLKEKKKEKRSSSCSGAEEIEAEDDYGFDKEKSTQQAAAAKSPVIKRQLPPTPAAPEEKSPHIYEEISDLAVTGQSDNDQKKQQQQQQQTGKQKASKRKASGKATAPSNTYTSTGPAGASGATAQSASAATRGDEINPYMVVPVDQELRQTPTNFHRNGTPEVHCDVIVKDTHCEILLSRKPKVTAFRPDSITSSQGRLQGESQGGGRVTSHIRNNTHFCSRDRRASTDTHARSAAANGSHSLNMTSSSTSRVHSMTSMSLSSLSPHVTAASCEETGSADSSAQGVVTYTSASNFIPRSTGLTFHPLEVTGYESDDEVESMNGANFFLEKENRASNSVTPLNNRGNNSAALSNRSSNSVPLSSRGSNCVSSPDLRAVTYSSIQEESRPETGSVCYASIQDPEVTSDADEHAQCGKQFCKSGSSSSFFYQLPGGDPLNKLDHQVSGSAHLRPVSPSASSNCTYASINIPTQPKLYNTICDVMQDDMTSRCGHEIEDDDLLSAGGPQTGSLCEEADSGVIYSDIHPEFTTDKSSSTRAGLMSYPDLGCAGKVDTDDVMYSRIPSYHVGMTSGGGEKPLLPYGHGSVYRGKLDGNGNVRDASLAKYTGIRGCSGLQVDLTGKSRDNNNVITGSHDVLGDSSVRMSNHALQLEFCACSDDQHSSSCGCADGKQEDDDVTSVVDGASGLAEGAACVPSSCKGCGRLIRQITYSESLSDDTYEHVYSSRLLTRRRYSSPEITWSETASDSPELQESVPARARDDSWTTAIRRDDVISKECCLSGDVEGHSLDLSHDVQGHTSHAERLDHKLQVCMPGLEAQPDLPRPLSKLLRRQNSSPVSSESSSLSGGPAGRGLHRISFTVASPALGKPDSAPLPPNTNWEEKPDTQEPQQMTSLHNESPKVARLSSTQRGDVTQDGIKKSGPAGSEGRSGTGGGFYSLFSIFSRSNKSKHLSKNDRDVAASVQTAPDSSKISVPDMHVARAESHPSQSEAEHPLAALHTTPGCEQNVCEIPERNTRRLSKLFQMMSSREISSAYTDLNGNDVKHEGHASAFQSARSVSNGAVSLEKCPDGEIGDTDTDWLHELQVQLPSLTGTSDVIGSTSGQRAAVNVSAAAGETNPKAGNKTDSGDTCYEYDISTSSESEQTGYDYFLSKVKKSLNLEQEVRHIAESSLARRKLLCKRCRRDAVYSTTEDEAMHCGGTGCPHMSSKIGDLKDIFGELVVDQRAAILDCLTHFTHSPYSVRCPGQESQCRECGGDVMTSDSDSLTTVYSMMSQQLLMTSQGRRSPSGDSDEGTMADNSDDSADEEKPHSGHNYNNNNNNNNNNSNSNDNFNNNSKKNNKDADSSGYDEAGLSDTDRTASGASRSKRRDKLKDKKEKRIYSGSHHHHHHSHHNNNNHNHNHNHHHHDKHSHHHHHSHHSQHSEGTSRKWDKTKKKTSASTAWTDDQPDIEAEGEGCRSPECERISKRADRKGVQEASGGEGRRGGRGREGGGRERGGRERGGGTAGFKKSTSSTDTDRRSGAEDDADQTTSVSVGTKSWRMSGSQLMSERAIQDIYAPLPSKALSLLTGNQYKTLTNASCLCGRSKKAQGTGASVYGSGSLLAPNMREKEGEPAIMHDEACERRGEEDKMERKNIEDKEEAKCELSVKSNSVYEAASETMDTSGDRTKTPAAFLKEVGSNPDLIPRKIAQSELTKHTSQIVSDNTGHDTLKISPVEGTVDTSTEKSSLNRETEKSIVSQTLPHSSKSAALDTESSVPSLNPADVGSKSTHRRRHKLELATLDLLPETALGGDTSETTQVKSIPSRRSRSNIVEKMTKLFEGQTIPKSPVSATSSAGMGHVGEVVNSQKDPSSPALVTPFVTSVVSGPGVKETTARDKPDVTIKSHRGEKMSGSSGSSSRGDNSSETRALGAKVKVGKITSGEKHRASSRQRASQLSDGSRSSGETTEKKRSRSRSRRRENNSGDVLAKSGAGNLAGKKEKVWRSSGSGDEEGEEEEGENRGERGREGVVKHLSPTPSSVSSSSSSSSLSKKKKSASKQRRVGKKSYHKRKSKSRSERSKSASGRVGRESGRTCYYFSSDLSDIDVVEVEDWDTYARTLTPTIKAKEQRSSRGSSGRHSSTSRKNAQTDDVAGSKRVTSQGHESGSEEQQEVYAIPPSSAELRQSRGVKEAGSNPSPGGEGNKTRPHKRTDVYRTRKCQNKLLSDVIIRNYDMQLFGNV